MIRLRPLRPREKRNLRHWAMEFFVVVAGVLLALWAQEWVGERRDAKIRDEALAEVDRAIDEGLSSLAHHRAIQHCVEQQRDILLAELRKPGERWTGIDVPMNRYGLQSDAFAFPYISVVSGFTTAPWDSARGVGVFDRMDREQAQAYSDLETIFEWSNKASETLLRATALFAPLSVDRTLSQDQRLELEQILAEADLARSTIQNMRQYAHRRLHAIDWEMDPDIRAESERTIKMRVEQWGDCAQIVDPFPSIEEAAAE